VLVLQIVPIILWAERKLLGRFQARVGPNRVGPYGLMQPIADVLKLLSKEQSTPSTAVPWMMALAPVISIFTAVCVARDHPVRARGRVGRQVRPIRHGRSRSGSCGRSRSVRWRSTGWCSEAGVGSKYSFLGAMRSAAQLISYEVSLGLSLLGVILTAGSLSLVQIVEAQAGMWYVVPQFVGFVIFMVAGFAETNRRRSTCPRPTPRSSAATTPSTAACASARSSWPSTSTSS